MKEKLHVFSGKFDTREVACKYSEAQWEPEPDDSVSDEEYEAWEERNPTWAMKDELSVDYLDSDFIETISGKGILRYLDTQLATDEERSAVRNLIPTEHNTLVLIMSKSYEGFETSFSSTSVLDYHGEYTWNPYGE